LVSILFARRADHANHVIFSLFAGSVSFLCDYTLRNRLLLLDDVRGDSLLEGLGKAIYEQSKLFIINLSK
jgi:hypothetical protein